MPELTLSSGRRLAYEHFGDPDGVPAFYFHGWPSSRLQGKLMDAEGRRRHVHVVAMDRPGIGKSEFHPGRTLQDWPPLLEELASHLGWDRFHVFGISGGGPYALMTAFAMPDRVLSTNYVCGAPPLTLHGTQDLFWTYQVVLGMRRHAPFLLAPSFRAAALMASTNPRHPPMRWMLGWLCEADRQVLLDPFLGPIVTKGCLESLRSGVRGLRADGEIYMSDWGFDLADLRLPVHVWHGGKDRHIPISYARKTAALLPHAITHWTEDDGHFSMACNQVRAIMSAALDTSAIMV